MTTTLPLFANPTGPSPQGARSAPAQDQAVSTRTFDAIFAEAIDERPQAAPPPTPAAEQRPAQATDADERPADDPDEGEAPDQAEPAAEGAAGASPRPDRESPPPEGERGPEEAPIVAQERPDEPVREHVEPVRGKRAAKVSAGAIQAEITHAADVDLASLHAQELTQAGSDRRPGTAALEPGKPPEGSAPEQAGARRPFEARADVGSGREAGKGEAPALAGGVRAEATKDPNAPAIPAAVAPPGAGPTPAQMGGAARAAAGVGQEAMGRLAVLGARVAAAVQGPASSAGATPAVGLGRAEGAAKLMDSATAAQSRQATPTRQPVLAQVQRGLASVLKNEGGAVTLKLNPQSLGEVKVEVTLKEGGATARFEASTPSAHRLLTENLSTLRQALEAKGVRVDALSVELRSGMEAPPEVARGDRPGTEAGRGQQPGGGPPHETPAEARSETGAGEQGRHGEDRQGPGQRAAHAAGIAQSVAGAEHPEGTVNADPFSIAGARTPGHEGWIGLDTVA